MPADAEQLAAAPAQLTIILPPLPEAAGMARRAMREALASWVLEHLIESATLLTSELVGNAVRHARTEGSALELRLHLAGNLLRIEVLDTDPRTPTLRDGNVLEEGGFGLVLVDALADNWGVRRTNRGKAVWFELRSMRPGEHDHQPPDNDGKRWDCWITT